MRQTPKRRIMYRQICWRLRWNLKCFWKAMMMTLGRTVYAFAYQCKHLSLLLFANWRVVVCWHEISMNRQTSNVQRVRFALSQSSNGWAEHVMICNLFLQEVSRCSHVFHHRSWTSLTENSIFELNWRLELDNWCQIKAVLVFFLIFLLALVVDFAC